MNDRLLGVPEFVRAVEAGSFTLAAARLGVTRSAIAKAVAKVEARLDTRLFDRTTRRQSLTENGLVLYESYRRALDEVEAAEAALDAGRREPAGRLRVTASSLFGRRHVMPVLANLMQLHPALEVELSLSDRVVDLIEDGFDLAIRIGALRDSATLAARRIAAQAFALYAAPRYLRRHGRPRRPEDYDGHVAIAYGRAGRDRPWLLADADGNLVELAVSRRMRCDDVGAIADAALAGYGMARLPTWLAAPHVKAGSLVLLAADACDSSSRTGASASAAASNREHDAIYAVWPASRYLPAKTRAAIDALVVSIPKRLKRDGAASAAG